MFNHNKVYCVDKKLLYIGSDNPYPNYNEEHGIWIDDAKAITGWYDANFSLRWTSERTKVADMSPGDRSTMKEFPGSLFG
jgi:phosphatidylserine/phosphatidylglycerophosphate/cardiolipin synthase-like enzyme